MASNPMSVLPRRLTRSMPSRTVETALRDILHHIDLATRFATDFSRVAFTQDTKTVYAVTRCPEIISEASRRLPDDLKSRHPSIAWKQMAGAGNVYRHDYEDTLPRNMCGTRCRATCRLCARLSTASWRTS